MFCLFTKRWWTHCLERINYCSLWEKSPLHCSTGAGVVDAEGISIQCVQCLESLLTPNFKPYTYLYSFCLQSWSAWFYPMPDKDLKSHPLTRKKVRQRNVSRSVTQPKELRYFQTKCWQLLLSFIAIIALSVEYLLCTLLCRHVCLWNKVEALVLANVHPSKPLKRPDCLDVLRECLPSIGPFHFCFQKRWCSRNLPKLLLPAAGQGKHAKHARRSCYENYRFPSRSDDRSR